MKREPIRTLAERSAKHFGFTPGTDTWSAYCQGYENGHKRGTTHGKDLLARRLRVKP